MLPDKWHSGLKARIEWEVDPTPLEPIAMKKEGFGYEEDAYAKHAANYQKYKVCAVPQKTVHAEHREMLQKIKDKDKDGMKELVLRHLSNLIDFAKLSTKGEIPEFEYGHI
jgi:hypothetical protein